MKTIISIDPGLSTGVIVGTYSDEEPFRVTHAFQIEGGVEGFLENTDMTMGDFGEYATLSIREKHTGTFLYAPLWDEDLPGSEAVVLVEKFTARGGANSGFSYTTASLEPLRVEGAILALGINPQWVSPAQQYFLGGKSLQEKLKARNAWLKEHAELGYYLTGKSVGQKDADDARSALSHAISWLRRNRHEPTMNLFRKGEDESN